MPVVADHVVQFRSLACYRGAHRYIRYIFVPGTAMRIVECNFFTQLYSIFTVAITYIFGAASVHTCTVQ